MVLPATQRTFVSVGRDSGSGNPTSMESVMRRILKASILCLAAGVLNACTPEEVTITEDIPTAGVRFIHAVPDTGAMDFRPVDIVENSTFYGVGFRAPACCSTRTPGPAR